ncbi:hypothetical protein LTSEWAN_0660 [Salmonella enterica subsp. enterica serovar Wandsworth str. A4-580]|uniref:Uncharacterized protein n=1 Tax=Salmonella enterica subsp. enterica serovar Wandsworth str. A4-580 TaxID=913086 RepID=G5S779_SALET|nr:hypothetical protein LTSEWAN_0660 [Salmonella enterica subsp. enterica serovar Wandsworth str. A4-580]
MKFTTRIKHHSHEKVMANHANKKSPNVECFNEPVLTAKKISQHPLVTAKKISQHPSIRWLMESYTYERQLIAIFGN